MKDIQMILLVVVLLLASTLVVSPILVPNTILAGAGGVVVFSDGSTIDLTNSTSYVGTPLGLIGGGDIWSRASGRVGGGVSGSPKLIGEVGGGVTRFGGRHFLCLIGQQCSSTNSTDVPAYIAFNLGSLTFMVALWYVGVGIVFWVVLFLMVGTLFLGKRQRKKRR